MSVQVLKKDVGSGDATMKKDPRVYALADGLGLRALGV